MLRTRGEVSVWSSAEFGLEAIPTTDADLQDIEALH